VNEYKKAGFVSIVLGNWNYATDGDAACAGDSSYDCNQFKENEYESVFIWEKRS